MLRAVVHLALIATLALLVACGDTPPEPPAEPPAEPPQPSESAPAAPSNGLLSDLDAPLPSEVGPFVAEGEVTWGANEIRGQNISSAKRVYRDGQRELEVELFDTRLAPVLGSGFMAARQLEEEQLDVIARAIDVGSLPGLLQWERRSGESSVQVLTSNGVLVQVKVWPADTPDHVLRLLAALDLQTITRRRVR